ncbi:acetyl-CoA hydrolase/transferase family protein [Tropicimonas sp. TH_r6]|uniref:acetyl-CoA hydrolase/transferase family protein n=1 Tax=Tropicimonas sp. TH_r6 TaxID=3082085 RepID=UPI0029548769|nr:acetyl-CoA hydrolase/transferase family protein [Tropicimonas sp. TH_r6]MDV7142584.1 acetyl-CoA hydrolase/transferase family protein [Tropicimonas sp. TH_r6]
MAATDRIKNSQIRSKVMSAEDAASLIKSGDTVGMSGFTGSGYPKALPTALAAQIHDAHEAGDPFKIGLWTGASTGPELDGALAKADAIKYRLPYNSDPIEREKINRGEMDYFDLHLSHVAPMVWEGFFGNLDVAVIEITGIKEDGSLIPATSIGNNKTWIDRADKVILEVNKWHDERMEGMHDIYYGTALPPNRVPIPMTHADDRIGQKTLRCDPHKVVGVIETELPDKNAPFPPLDDVSKTIAGHLMEFLKWEVKKGRLTNKLLPLQSGVGNVANAVLAGLRDTEFHDLMAYTEVIQDGMMDLIDDGKMLCASSTAFGMSDQAAIRFRENLDFYRDKIILRPQEISNHPEVIRRLGTISMNGMIEADIFGNINSTHVMSSRIMNGIGGSGDFTRNAYLSCFVSPSIAKGGDISTIVPQVCHVDHITQDVMVIVTEQGLADLRGMPPKQRAETIMANCAHPSYRPMLQDYYDRAKKNALGLHTPAMPGEALSWHQRFLETKSMRF